MTIGRALHLIGGRPTVPSGGSYAPVRDPSTGKMIGEMALGTPADAAAAVEAAHAEEKRWGETPGHERARILLAISERLRADGESIATLISREVGKPIRDSRIEVERAVGVFAMAADEIRHLTGESFPIDAYPMPLGNEKRLAFTVRDPVGVVVAISPFNFPLNLLAHKVAPALASGNPVVAKPASAAPFTALRLAEHAFKAGVPPGVFNVLLGKGEDAGMALVGEKRTRLVTFTGSTRTGRAIAERAGRDAKRIILEMGGMDPLLVFKDAPIDSAVEAALQGSFGYSGQVCTATKRIFVEEKVAERFSKSLAIQAKNLKVGPALSEETNVGPLIDAAALARMDDMVEEAVGHGAILLSGGARLKNPKGGNFYSPTVLDRVSTESTVVREEPFGPIAPIQRFSVEEEAISMANETDYGLQAAVYTRDIGRAFRVARQLRVGAVHLNDPTTLRWDALPFGGVKLSGLGREGLHYVMEEMTEIKTISIRGT